MALIGLPFAGSVVPRVFEYFSGLRDLVDSYIACNESTEKNRRWDRAVDHVADNYVFYSCTTSTKLLSDGYLFSVAVPRVFQLLKNVYNQLVIIWENLEGATTWAKIKSALEAIKNYLRDFSADVKEIFKMIGITSIYEIFSKVITYVCSLISTEFYIYCAEVQGIFKAAVSELKKRGYIE